MKSYRGLLVVFVCTVVLVVIGCVSALKGVKQPDEASQKESPKASTEQTKTEQDEKKATAEELKRLLTPPPPPQYKPPAAGDQKTASEAVIDPTEKEEVSRAALEFAGHVKNVKNVKICYSKLYGGWYLMLYVQKSKKISLDQYSWNRKSQEWEIVYHLKEIPQKQLEFHVKGEVGDEKCFVLQ